MMFFLTILQHFYFQNVELTMAASLYLLRNSQRAAAPACFRLCSWRNLEESWWAFHYPHPHTHLSSPLSYFWFIQDILLGRNQGRPSSRRWLTEECVRGSSLSCILLSHLTVVCHFLARRTWSEMSSWFYKISFIWSRRNFQRHALHTPIMMSGRKMVLLKPVIRGTKKLLEPVHWFCC